MYKESGWKKALALLLVASILAPSIILSRPKESDAFLGCFANKLISKFGDKLKNKTKDTLQSAFGANVPVLDRTNASINKDIRDEAQAIKAEEKIQTTKDCLLDFAVNVVAKILIKSITKSIVNWINGGFNGAPSFVTNVDGFLSDIGDQVIGEAIRNMGDVGEVLCSPFDLDLRLALGLHYSSSFTDIVTCRLSDVQQNIQNAFTSGNFGGQAGWDQWFAIHSSPRNNPYGSFMALSSGIDARISGRHQIGLKKLDWGRGFLAWEDCKGATNEEEKKQMSDAGKCTTNTPGSVIQDQLTFTLGSETRQIEVADEINEIMGALMNQALVQVMSATGLSGTTKAPAGGGKSYFDNYVTGDTEKDFQSEISLSSTELPVGLENLSCALFNQDIYTVEGGVVYVQVYDPSSKTDRTKRTHGPQIEAVKENGEAWSSNDLDTVNKFCATNTLREYNGAVTPETDVDLTTPEQEEYTPEETYTNLAIRQKAEQSSEVYHDWYGVKQYFSAGNAVDGNVNANGVPAETEYGDKKKLSQWGVYLKKTSYIDSIRIFKHGSRDYSSALGEFIVNVYNESGGLVWSSEKIKTSGKTIVPLEIQVGKIGQRVQIIRTGNGQLVLAEVEVMGTEDLRKAGITPEVPGNVPLSVTIESDLTDTLEVPRFGGTGTKVPLTINTNKDLSDLSLSISLEKKIDNNSLYGLRSFGSLFSPTEGKSLSLTLEQGSTKIIDNKDMVDSSVNKSSITYPEKFDFKAGELKLEYNINPSGNTGTYRLTTKILGEGDLPISTNVLDFVVKD